MNQVQKEITVNTPSEEYEAMASRWEKVDDIMGGTESMRRAGTRYVEKFHEETPQEFNSRLSKAVFYNKFKETLNTLVGRVFSRKISWGDDMNAQLVEWFDDIDGKGIDIQRFAKKVFYAAYRDRVAFIEAVYPSKREIDEKLFRAYGYVPKVITRQMIEKNAIRPRLVFIDARNVIEFSDERVRIRETKWEQDGWGWRATNCVRVLTPGHYEIYEEHESADKKKEWILVDNGEVSIKDHIPIQMVCFDPENEGDYCGEIPLNTLADLCINHWVFTVSKNTLIERSMRFAVIGKGVDDDIKLYWGGSQLTGIPVDADIKVLESNCEPIKAGERQLDQLEAKMEMLSIDPLVKQYRNDTATAASLSAGEKLSALGANTASFCAALSASLADMAAFGGLGENAVGEVSMDIRIGVETVDFERVKAAGDARIRGDISQREFLSVYKKYVNEDADIESIIEETKLEDEAVNFAAFGGSSMDQKSKLNQKPDNGDGDDDDDDGDKDAGVNKK